MGTASIGHAAETAGVKEHQVKAAFIYNFAKFVEWPTNRAATGTTNATNLGPIVLGVAGKSPCVVELEQIVAGRKINGRDLLVRAVASPADAGKVHVLFVTAGEDDQLEDWLSAGHEAGILTVGETEAFAKRGGMIRFLIEAEKIRFDVNMEAAEKAGLKLSAQLLKLARTVRRKD